MTQFGNFNRCIELSQTKYFGMLHDDDLLVLNYFRVVKAILPRLMEKNNIGVVQAKYKYIFDDVLEEKTRKIMIRSISKRNITILGLSGIGAPTCGTIFNKEALLKCGGFNHDFTSSGDMILGGVLINNEGYANYCIAYLLNLVTKKYVSFVGNPKLMNNVMANITINIPPIEEQKKVSNIMELLDEEIVLQTKKLDKLIEQRKALQQYLLTGIVRV